MRGSSEVYRGLCNHKPFTETGDRSMFLDPREDPNSRRHIREAKVRAHLDLVASPANYMFYCREKGIIIPRGMSYDSFEEWLPSYLGSLSDDDLVLLMNKLGLTVVSTTDKWNGIFIIHSSRDESIAEAIRFGLNCINIPDSNIYCSSIEETGTRLGDSFCDIIKKCLQNAILVICIMSDYSVDSKYCLQEMGAAFVMDVPLIPILANGFDPQNMPGFIDNTRYQASTITTAMSAEMFLKNVCKKCGIECNHSDLLKGVRAILTAEES